MIWLYRLLFAVVLVSGAVAIVLPPLGAWMGWQ